MTRSKLIRHSLIVGAFSVIAIILSFFYLDHFMAFYFHLDSLQHVYYYSREITNIGLGTHYFVIAILGLLFSLLLHSRLEFINKRVTHEQNLNVKNWSLQLLKSLVILGLCLPVIKFIFGRQRPHLSPEFSENIFSFFTFDWHFHSFPSGHSQVLFTVATILLLIWPRQKYWFLILAALLSLTRVTIQQHFLSDVIGGAMIGYLGTLWIYELWPPAKAASSSADGQSRP